MNSQTPNSPAARISAPEDMSPEGKEAVEKLNALMDLLRWFHDQGICLKIRSKKDGYKIELTAK